MDVSLKCSKHHLFHSFWRIFYLGLVAAGIRVLEGFLPSRRVLLVHRMPGHSKVQA